MYISTFINILQLSSKKFMKKLCLTICFFFALLCVAKSQVIDDENGKTFYYIDNDKKQVKEIFHHIRKTKFGKHNGVDYDSTIYIKHGPYLKYYTNGKLECSGYYNYEKPDGVWKNYSNEGQLISINKYIDGKKMD